MIHENVLENLEFSKVLEQIAKYTVTENGKNIILATEPLQSIDEIVRQGKLVDEAKDILIHNDIPPINFIPDLNEALSRSKIEGSVLDKKVIFDILALAENSRRLYQFLKSRETETRISSEIANGLFVDKVFEHHISQVFTETGEIRDNATDKLKSIRKEINDKGDSLRKVVGKLLKKLTDAYLVQEEYMTQRDGRIVLPIKAEHKRHVRGFIHSESATGQTVYIEPEETLELNNEILSLTFAEKREVERILRNLTIKVGESSEELKRSLAIIAEIDSIFAKAKYSIEIIGAFPTFNENEPLRILNSRHPLLLKRLGRENTVPLFLEIKDNRVVLITGPNAGGKTVVLKTVGLLYLMVLSGIHIPSDPDSNLHFIDTILMDIGDKQSIEDDLSTFSSHLSNTKEILEKANKNSFIFLDEVGTGTDPAEGSALAAAILISLRNKNAYVMATTHHGNLKLIANDLNGFQNAAMEFDNEHLKPTYIFKQGLPGSSYAFEVAERIGFDKEFTKLAKEYLDTNKTKVEEFLVDLENKSKLLQDKLNKSELENTRLKGLANLYQTQVTNLEKQKKEILNETKKKADSYLKDVNKRVENAIKVIKESNADKKVIKEERKKLEEVKYETKDLFKEEVEPTSKNYEFKVGDNVLVKNTATDGIISEIDQSKKEAVITSGNIKLRVKINNLVLSKKKSKEPEQTYRPQYIAEVSNYRLDIRGKKPEEAEFEVIRFIDDAYASSMKNVEILHGKGSGVLKNMVHEILKKHESVKDYYHAHVEMGGEGITIIELK